MTAKSICFVGNDNYPVLNPAYGRKYIGGESVQQTLLAKAFVGSGYKTKMVVCDFGQEDGEWIDNIQVWKTYRPEAGVPVVRFFYPRLSSIIRALKKADADIYYQSCAGMLTGVVAWFCKQYRRRFIFRIAHDTDCVPGEQIIKYSRDRKIYEYGLRQADLISAQGVVQQELLMKNYRLQSDVVNMVVEIPEKAGETSRDIDVLWVNNMRSFKRPELAIELARDMSDVNFTMIGGAVPGELEYFDRIKKSARNVPNLDFKGAVPYDKVNSYFGRARLFVNTSESEGFPNSFLQAWARGAPVVSFFDPDGLIETKRLGSSPKTLAEMKENIAALLSDNDRRIQLGSTVRDFVIARYAAEKVARQYIALLDS